MMVSSSLFKDIEFNGKPEDDDLAYPNPFDTKGDKNKNTTGGDEEEKVDLSDVPLDKAYQGNKLEDENTDFVVDNPITQAGHIVYHVKGVDKQGQWEGNRRYNEFYVLH